MPPTNFEAFMYTASRALAFEKKGSFSDARTTSPHMLEYFRYDIPAMRQYACEARRGGYFLPSARPGKNGVCKHEKPRRARWWPGGSTTRRSGGRGVDPGCARGWIARLATVRGRGEAPGATGGTPRASRSSPERHPVVPVVDGAFPVRAGARARATKPRRETDVVRCRERSEGVRTAELAAADMVSRVDAPSARGRCGDATCAEQDRPRFWETFVQGFAFYVRSQIHWANSLNKSADTPVRVYRPWVGTRGKGLFRFGVFTTGCLP